MIAFQKLYVQLYFRDLRGKVWREKKTYQRDETKQNEKQLYTNISTIDNQKVDRLKISGNHQHLIQPGTTDKTQLRSCHTIQKASCERM